jgi:hypothetical protein
VISQFERAYEYGVSKDRNFDKYREGITTREDYKPPGKTPMARAFKQGTRPSSNGVYREAEDAEEMWVEARRLYQENPDWFRAVYPDAGRMLSTVINQQAKHHRNILNGVGAGMLGLLTGGARQMRTEDAQTETSEQDRT